MTSSSPATAMTSITGDAGNDTISITGGGHTIAGGAGADKFIFGAGTTTSGHGAGDRRLGRHAGHPELPGLHPQSVGLHQATSAATYADALVDAQQLTTQNHFSFVGVQVGADFIIFAGGSGGPEQRGRSGRPHDGRLRPDP